MKKLVATLLATILLTVNASAVDITDLSVGISGGQGVFAATGTENEFDEAGSTSHDTTEYGAFVESWATLFVEFDASDDVSIGLSYVPVTLVTPENINSGSSATNTSKVKAEFEDWMTLYAKINLPNLGGAFAKVGYSIVDINTIETQASGNTYPNTDTTGIMVGLGYEVEVGDGVALRAEVNGHNFDDVQVDNGQTNKNVIKVKDMIGLSGHISLVKSF